MSRSGGIIAYLKQRIASIFLVMAVGWSKKRPKPGKEELEAPLPFKYVDGMGEGEGGGFPICHIPCQSLQLSLNSQKLQR
jgi:hypothetical protein